MNPIVQALLDDPAILALNALALAQDIRIRFGVSAREAYAAIVEAGQIARDAGIYPAELARFA